MIARVSPAAATLVSEPRRSALRMSRPLREEKKTHPSQRGWNVFTKQVSLPALGSLLEEGRARFVFQHRTRNC